jgi:hypothetical protein
MFIFSINILSINLGSARVEKFSRNLIGCSALDTLHIFTSRPKQNVFPFSSGYRRQQIVLLNEAAVSTNTKTNKVLFNSVFIIGIFGISALEISAQKFFETIYIQYIDTRPI